MTASWRGPTRLRDPGEAPPRPPENKESKPLTGKAASFDIDGTLIKTNVVHAYGYYGMNEGSLTGILRRPCGASAIEAQCRVQSCEALTAQPSKTHR